MSGYFFLTIIIIGLSGIVAQVLLLRELLVSFNGNELTLGVVLANWVISEGLGAFIGGRLIDRTKNKISIFIILEVIFLFVLPLSVYSSRVLKYLLGFTFAEAVGIFAVFYSSLLIIFPVSFCHGALFSTGCKLYASCRKDSAVSVGRVYTWETLGAIAGGVILTYLFIPYLNSFRIVFIILAVNSVICLLFIRCIEDRKLRCLVFIIFTAVNLIYLTGLPDYLHNLSLKKQYRIGQILDYRNSVYGNIMVSREGEQYTFLYNGNPIITVPYPDITFVEEFGNLPLLFHNSPKDVFILSAGAGGLIGQILQHPVARIDYAELDPLIIKLLRDYPVRLTQEELSDARVNIHNIDGRFLLKNNPRKYDVILIGLSRPSDLSTNRLFTQEFFSLAKSRLNQDGVLALWLPGSLTYLSKELRDLNFCVLNALGGAFSHVRVIPGDYNMLLASENENIMDIGADTINQRLSQSGIKTNMLTPGYINYRLDKKWLEWFLDSSKGATSRVNRDLSPFAVFEMLIFWNKQFYPKFSYMMECLVDLDLRLIFFIMAGVTLGLFLIFARNRRQGKLAIAYSIATTGFLGMMMNLVLIFAFQVFYGYLYHKIGLLISVLMAGVAIGSILATALLRKVKNHYAFFLRIETAAAVFSCLLAFILTAFSGYLTDLPLIFVLLFLIPGFIIGAQFPLASRIYSDKSDNAGSTAGTLYFADLIGGWLAGILGGVVFLPILGVFNTCLAIAIVKISSLILLTASKNKLTRAVI